MLLLQLQFICLHPGILLCNVQTTVRTWGDACPGGNTVSTLEGIYILALAYVKNLGSLHLNCFYCGKSIHNIKFTILTIFQCQSIMYFHIIVQQSPPFISRTSLSSQTETTRLLNNCPLSSPGALATNILLFVFMNLTTLGTLYKWNHTIFVFL